MSTTLYHQALVQRAKAAYGKGRLDNATASITLDNPLCGDRVTVDIQKAGEQIGAIGHHVRGCILCEAAAATIAEYCRNHDLTAARSILPAIRAMMRDGDVAPADWPCLDIFTPVHSTKSRRDCVLLPFEAFEKAIAAAF